MTKCNQWSFKNNINDQHSSIIQWFTSVSLSCHHSYYLVLLFYPSIIEGANPEWFNNLSNVSGFANETESNPHKVTLTYNVIAKELKESLAPGIFVSRFKTNYRAISLVLFKFAVKEPLNMTSQPDSKKEEFVSNVGIWSLQARWFFYWWKCS